jgi:hypothetical protein
MDNGKQHEQKRPEKQVGQELPPEQGEEGFPGGHRRREQHGAAKKERAIKDRQSGQQGQLPHRGIADSMVPHTNPQ